MFKVTIVGRPNVGKSTLFNRLIEEKKSIVSNLSGTTRDRIYGQCFWRGKCFELIDVGGLKIKKSDEILEKEIQKQIESAIKEGNLILFLLDGKVGITAEDREIARKLKKIKKPVLLVVNKIDSPKERKIVEEENFLKLGLGQPILVSAANGSGLGDLLDEMVNQFIGCIGSQAIKNPKTQASKYQSNQITKIAIVGRTNVGKSTLINSILGQERVVVTPLPHTTREPIDTFFEYKGKPLILIDTAGIRKKTKIKSQVERVGVEKSLKMIKRADIVFLLLDVLEMVSFLDKKLAGLIKEEKKAAILVINKLDLIKTDLEKYIQYYQQALPNLWWVPIIFISAKEKINLEKLLDLTLEIKEKMRKIFAKNELNKVFKETIFEYNFKESFWSEAKLKQQIKNIPSFLLVLPKLTRKEKPPVPAQLNLLEKNLRKKFNLWGVPIEIELKIKN
jgi:GTP-binding protein